MNVSDLCYEHWRETQTFLTYNLFEILKFHNLLISKKLVTHLEVCVLGLQIV